MVGIEGSVVQVEEPEPISFSYRSVTTHRVILVTQPNQQDYVECRSGILNIIIKKINIKIRNKLFLKTRFKEILKPSLINLVEDIVDQKFLIMINSLSVPAEEKRKSL